MTMNKWKIENELIKLMHNEYRVKRMDEWMDEWVNKWIIDRINVGMNECINECTYHIVASCRYIHFSSSHHSNLIGNIYLLLFTSFLICQNFWTKYNSNMLRKIKGT